MKSLVILIFMSCLVWACANVNDEKIGSSEFLPLNTKVEMADWSELAILMRQIHKDAKRWKKKLEKGELVSDSVNIYKQLVESKPTDEEVTGPAFNHFANNYQRALTEFVKTKDLVFAKEKYNNLVSTCVSCHKSFCPSPVKTIKKLYINH